MTSGGKEAFLKESREVKEKAVGASKGDVFSKNPDGKKREPHPDTGDTHLYPEDSIPW